MPTILLSNPLGADDAERIGLPDVREYGVGELIVVDDFSAFTLIRTGYGTAVGNVTDILIVGTGTPASNIGADGQWYLDSYSEVLWGPKTNGQWPTDPIRPDRGVAHFQVDGRGHLMMTYSTGTVVDLGCIIGPPNVLTTGPVTTLAPGQPATVTITTTGVGQQELDLSIPQGAKGDQGIQGIQGNTGPTGRGFTPRGAWAPSTVYAVDDIVTNGGSTYRAKAAHTSGATFTGAGTNWELWAATATLTDATASAKGAVQLAGDLAGTAAAPTVPALANKVNTSVVGQPSGVASLDTSGKVPASQIPAGATGSDQGSVTVDTTTTPGSAIVTIGGNWGLTDTGQVYYDPAGAVAAEAAMLVPDPDGNGFSLFRPGGPWTSEDARVAAFAGDTTSRLRAALDGRYGVLWGTGTALPTLAANPALKASDTYAHTTWGMLVWNGTSWVQDQPAQLTATQRAALATTGMPLAFQVFETDTGATATWNGTAWQLSSGAMPAAQIRQGTAQSVAANTWVPLTFQTADYDPDALFTSGSVTPVAVKRKGLYLVAGTFAISAPAGAIRVGAQLTKNGTAVPGGSTNLANASGVAGAIPTPSLLLQLNPADTVGISGVHSNSAALNTLVASDTACTLTVTCVRLLP